VGWISIQKIVITKQKMNKSSTKKSNSKLFIDLKSFLQEVESDFMEYVGDGHDLCYLSNLFHTEKDLDYNDPHVQQLYLLRYMYAYALENMVMYRWALSDRGNAKGLAIDSLGCGCFVDAWSMKNAATFLGYSTEGVVHTGVDRVSWNYKFANLGSRFIKKDAAEYLMGRKTLDSDIYIFPRSISDFSLESFLKIKQAFETKTITKPIIYLMISQRKETRYVNNKEELVVKQVDKKRTADLLRALLSRDFDYFKMTCEEDYDQNQDLRDYDKLFDYPWNTYALFDGLKWKCTSLGTSKCLSKCPITRKPMLKMKHLSYNVFKFERE